MFNALEYQRNWQKKNPEKISKYCKQWREKSPEKVRESNKKWHQKDKEMLHEIKINGCAICGYNKCDRALDFHHVNPEDKKFPVTANNIGKKFFIDEVNKCILLCKNCHMEIHSFVNPP